MTAVQEHAITPTAPVPPMRPSRYLVAARIQETYDTVTLLLRPVDDPIQVPRPGQFTMLYAFGRGRGPGLGQRHRRRARPGTGADDPRGRGGDTCPVRRDAR